MRGLRLAVALAAASVAAALAPAPGALATAPTAGPCAGTIPTRVGTIGGIVPVRPAGAAGGVACPGAPAGAASATPPSSPYAGTPPLHYNGGPVMGTSGAVTITPIFWAPSGFGFASGYESLVQQFLTDAAAASGSTRNVFSQVTEYTDGGSSHIAYDFALGTAVDATDPYPSSGGCTPDTGQVYADGTGYSACVTDAEIQSELAAVLAGNSLPSDLGHLYLVFLPKGVESCLDTRNVAGGGSCTITASGGTFCGYHSYAGSTIYADLPYAVTDSPVSGLTCSSDAGSLEGGGSVGNQSPNGDLAADTVISVASHEISEALTDPHLDAWYDSSRNEIADDCAYIYGDTSSFGGSAGAEYNQTINGDHYFLQEEFSNHNYALNPADACTQGIAWTTQTVTFDPNGGTGTMSPQSENTPTALTLNAFTRVGYSFAGWNTARDGSGTAYADGATYAFTASVTLYAQWVANPSFTVTFDPNGESGSMSPETSNVPAALTLNAFTRVGYSFAGWNTARDGSGSAYADGATYAFTASVTLYAQWVANPSFTVTFDPNGGSGSMSPETSNVPAALTLNAFTRVGYSFAGWNTARDGSGTAYADGATYAFTASVTLYAQWVANPSFTVTFDPNGGSGSMS